MGAPNQKPEIESLQRQLAALKQNLLSVQEQQTKFIDPGAIPPDLRRSELAIRQKIRVTQAKLRRLAGFSPTETEEDKSAGSVLPAPVIPKSELAVSNDAEVRKALAAC